MKTIMFTAATALVLTSMARAEEKWSVPDVAYSCQVLVVQDLKERTVADFAKPVIVKLRNLESPISLAAANFTEALHGGESGKLKGSDLENAGIELSMALVGGKNIRLTTSVIIPMASDSKKLLELGTSNSDLEGIPSKISTAVSIRIWDDSLQASSGPASVLTDCRLVRKQ